MSSLQPIRRRLASIDAFRALTMFFMIFVNDLILDSHVPDWLEHARDGEDRLGFADTIFPAFLFIVGLSIPLAIRYGRERGFSRMETVWHILRRAFALLVMGFFLVNYEEFMNPAPGIIGQFGFLLIITVAFFFVWLVYPEKWPVWKTWFFRAIGVGALVWMALIYKGGSPGHPMGLRPHWWGILGLIGWAYLCCALLYFLIGDRLWALGLLFLYFLVVSIGANSDWIPFRLFTLGGSGGLSAFTMGGVMTTVFYRRMMEKGKSDKSLGMLAIWAPVLVAAGFLLRPLHGISKLDDTPSWILICTGISVACVVVLGYLVDIKNQQSWYRWLKPAGTITLTCYLLPDIHFAIIKLLGESWRVPLVLRTGWIGVGKSLVFAFLIVLLTGVLEKKKIRLSI